MSSAGLPSSIGTADFKPDEAFARRLDEADPLAGYRQRFHLPRAPDGEAAIYFCGNSLGLQPRTARPAVDDELEAWAALAVDGHFRGRTPWYAYHEIFSDSTARLVGARPGEIVTMNSLTVNIHLMLVSFFQPTPDRHRILIEEPAFPSDLYAIQTHLRSRGLDPAGSLVQVGPREGEHAVRGEDLEAVLEAQGRQIALVWLGGVNYYTGQVFDMAGVTAAARRHGCTVGFDLAHAAGNVPLRLHDWNVDFACWCTYKYLNAGPGAVAGCFVHERHGAGGRLPRYAGWWGNDPETRFQMHRQREFVPQPGAAGWQISNPPILAMAPLKASLDIFDEAGMEALRHKSMLLTGYLRYLIQGGAGDRFEIITPAEPEAQGCQLSILVHDQPKKRHETLVAKGIVVDFREPDVIRVAPVPLYNTFHEVWRFSQVMLHGG